MYPDITKVYLKSLLRPVLEFLHVKPGRVAQSVADNSPSRISGRRNESMWPDRVSNPGLLVLEPDAPLTAVGGPASSNLARVYSA